MCGLYGFIKKQALTESDIVESQKALNIIKYRGPDFSGHWIDKEKGIYLGHNRLSIIDVSENNNQPAVFGKYRLIFNGEIYNYKVIRDRLIGLGHRFVTNGDTEVLIKGWAEWGETVLDYIDGMYAFCIYDGEACYLVVDNFSEKSIYYKVTDSGIKFSSELVPLIDNVNAGEGICTDKLYSILSLGYIDTPETLYGNIKKVESSSIVKIVNGNILDIKKYWVIPKYKIKKDSLRPITSKLLKEINDILTESISSRLISDVPLCLFLSSGIDSILIASIIKKELSKDIDAITVSFKNTSVNDESYSAGQAAEYLGIKHKVIDSSESSTSLTEVLNYYCQPNDNITITSVNQMCKVASKEYRVGITGMGGDELFFGYNKHFSVYNKRKIFGLPESLKSIIRKIASNGKNIHRHLSSLSDLYCVPREYIYIALKNYPIIDWLENLDGFNEWVVKKFDSDIPAELFVPYYDLERTMQNSQLTAYDLGSMRNSMELRTPFLCRKLLDKLAEVDPRVLMEYGQKNILKSILKNYLPEKFINNKKMGYVYPQDKFIRDNNVTKPKLKCLPEESIDKVWNHRFDNSSWSRMAVRLMMLEYSHC